MTTKSKPVKPAPIKTLRQLKQRLALMGPLTEYQKKSVVCALVGHSRIQEFCMGYYTCARCDRQLGDSLADGYPEAATAVVVGHDCLVCRANFKRCTWRDTFMAAAPFPKSDDQ